MTKACKKLLRTLILSKLYSFKYRLYQTNGEGIPVEYSNWIEAFTNGKQVFSEGKWYPAKDVGIISGVTIRAIMKVHVQQNHPGWFFYDYAWGFNNDEAIKLNTDHIWYKALDVKEIEDE
jgi:hypothetical protein